MQTPQPLFPEGLGALGREGSDHGASCLQSHGKASNRQRRGDRDEQPNPRGRTHRPAHAGHRGHNLHLTKGFSCHCLTGDDKVLLIQNMRDSPGKIAVLLFTCGHRPGLQARDLHRAQTSKVAGGLGRYSRPLALATAFCSVKTTPAGATTPLTGIDGETRCLIPPQGEPALAGSVDRTGRRQLQIAIFEQELHLATLKHVLKHLLNRALSTALHRECKGLRKSIYQECLKDGAEHNRKGTAFQSWLYAINRANK